MARSHYGRSTAVVGRDSELSQLERAVRSARDGAGGITFVAGEGGIGKTRLTQEAAKHAGELGMRVLRGRGSTIGPMVPFRPLTEVLLSLARAGALPDDQQLGSYRAVLGRLIPDWWTPGAAHSETSLVVLAEAVLRLLAGVGRDTGCLLVLDDLHDSDTETLAVVDYLADNLAAVPAAVIATVRDVPGDALTMAHDAVHRGSAELIELDRLDADQLGLLVAHCLNVDVDDVPTELTDELWKRTAGVPFVVEELLHVVIGNGLLRHTPDGWRMSATIHGDVPETLLRSVAARMESLGDAGRSVLAVAAVLGNRFSLTIVQEVTGLADREFLSYLRMAARMQLVMPDEMSADWYSFRHPLTVEALLAQLTPTRLAEVSGRVADAVQQLHPELPGEWCQQVAALRLASGEPAAAGVLFAEAGRRALADGAAGSAVVLLERADQLLTQAGDRACRLDLLGSLVPALTEVGRFDDARLLVQNVSAGEVPTKGESSQLAELHTHLAKAACHAALWAEANAQLLLARSLLGPSPSAEHLAAVDVVAAVVAVGSPEFSGGADPQALARSAVEVAAAVPLPRIAFDGWHALGLAARNRDTEEASACYQRALQIAEQHRLSTERVYALVRLANIRWLGDGDITGLQRAQQEADRLGMVVISYTIQANLAMHALLCAEFDLAEEIVGQCLPTVSRLKLEVIHRHMLVTRAATHGHRGRRREMEDSLAELRAVGSGESPQLSLAIGLAGAFCALAEDDVDRACLDLSSTAAYEDEHPGGYQLSGTHGLGILLRTLDGRPRVAVRTPEAAIAEGLRWNRHFVELASAVSLGRAGRTDEAAAAFRAAEESGSIFPTALHLGQRLVAEHALEAGWADGIALLRRAEQYFHAVGAPGLVTASRSLLRHAGASVQQRRVGADRVPTPLRTLGVTVREYEVLELLLERISNKEIGARLHISHRTVEKHVANLLTKTNLTDRLTLGARAADLMSGS